MAISLIKIKNFRNIVDAEIAPAQQGLNIISGLNGSGKTSLLEAIYYLGHNRSFRTSVANRLIHNEYEYFSLYSQVVNESGMRVPIGLERTKDGKTKLRLNNTETATVSTLSQLTPIRVINTQAHEILEAGPSHRRKYIDWGLFYQEPSFAAIWKQYERVLKQRNMALKARCPRGEYDAWTTELSKIATEMTLMRKKYLELIAPEVLAHLNQLLDVQKVEFVYQPGWNDAYQFADILSQNYHDELRAGVTQFGPHRANFDVVLDGVSAQHYLSRGQQKLLICAMILAQGTLLAKQANKQLTYLVDDLPAELDEKSQKKLLSLLLQQKTQIFITSIDYNTIFEAINQPGEAIANVFHVEHGKISARTTV